MKRMVYGILILFSFVLTAQPILAECEPYFTGGGIIMEGHGWDSLKITFATNLFYDEEGFPDGAIIFNFLNTNSGLMDGGTFSSKEISEFVIDPRELADVEDSEFLFVRVTATGEFYGEDGWTIRARFADFSGSNKKKEH